MQKNTSVSTEPHKCIFANKGIPNETMSFLKTFDLPAHWSATASVAADDIVPIDVRYAGP